MTLGLPITFRVLTKTKNEAAVPLLISGLDSPRRAVQEGALRAILDRRCVPGQKEIIRRLHLIDEGWRQIINERQARMTTALRDAVLSKDPQTCANGCQAALWFHEYDLMPTLINAAEDEGNALRNLVAKTLLELAQLLYDELSVPRNYENRRDPQLVRSHVVTSLEQSVVRYPKHHRNEILEAFLMLINRDNATLKQMLHDPRHGTYLSVVNLLSHSPRSGVMRLALSYLDDPHAPSAAITLLTHRDDPKFVESLLRKIGYEPSTNAAHNMKRMDSIPWLAGDLFLLDQMDDVAQHGAVQLAVRSAMNRQKVFRLLDYLLQHGKVGGRRAASAALAEFNGAEANSLCMRALNDQDPEVQAHAVKQLRQRGIPGAMTRLIELVGSPHEVVRQAARESLGEFTFKRYLGSFDMLEEQVRENTGQIVAKVDPEAAYLLNEEMTALSRTRRLRSLAMAAAMRMVPRMEEQTLRLLKDEDHVVRAEAARALAQCDTPAVREALREALVDRSYAVQEAAESSLRDLTGSAPEIPPRTAPSANTPPTPTAERTEPVEKTP